MSDVFTYWKEKFKDMTPQGLNKFFVDAFENEKGCISDIKFLSASMDRFFELGWMDTRTKNEEREGCIERGEAIAEMIKEIFANEEEKLSRFLEAYRVAKDYYQAFGPIKNHRN